MTEILALPGWNTPATELSRWVDTIQGQGHEVVTTRESPSVFWVEVASLRFRGYAVMQGQHVEAINFEITAPDPGPALAVIEQAATSLGWELSDDDEDDTEDD